MIQRHMELNRSPSLLGEEEKEKVRTQAGVWQRSRRWKRKQGKPEVERLAFKKKTKIQGNDSI